jgi:dipeptidyl aminopeptidase/acylaminoacyl peptidase
MPPYRLGARALELLASTRPEEVIHEVQQRDDIDPERAAATGASFGGYLANWIAGHTDRFAAIVTHASVWNLDRSVYPPDVAYVFLRHMTPETTDAHSPHHSVDDIVTPMLVIHGDKDYRVPIGQALRLWWDLSSRAKTEDGSSPHKFLYFPDEGHFIVKPDNLKACYETYLSFLDHHVRGQAWQRPRTLG